MKKKTIFFFCYRIMEFRIFISSGLLDQLAKQFHIVLIIHENSAPFVKELIDESIVVHTLRYKSEKKDSNKTTNRWANWLKNIFFLTYNYPRNYMPCQSRTFQVLAFLAYTKKKKSFISLILAYISIFISWTSSHCKPIRQLLQSFIKWTLRTNAHNDLYAKYKPDIVIVGSMGLDADGQALWEARHNGVRSVVINQSWDRIVCKGYPSIHPDHLIVWNQHQADEAYHYLSQPREKIHITGAIVWQYLFSTKNIKDRSIFLTSLKLNPQKKTILFLMSGDAWHNNLLKCLEAILHAKKAKKTHKNIQFIFRLHPYYWGNDMMRKELFEILKPMEQEEWLYIDYNNQLITHNYVLIHPGDQKFLHNCYLHSDLCISMTSSAMIEAILCSTPSISMNFGTWKNSKGIFPIENFRLHHVETLYSYGAIHKVRSLEELMACLDSDKFTHFWKEDNARTMIAREAVPTPELAVERTLETLMELACSSNPQQKPST